MSLTFQVNDVHTGETPRRKAPPSPDTVSLAPSREEQRLEALQEKQDQLERRDLQLAKVSLQMLRVRAGLM